MITSEMDGPRFRPTDRVRATSDGWIPQHLENHREEIVGIFLFNRPHGATIDLDEPISYQGKKVRQVTLPLDSLERA